MPTWFWVDAKCNNWISDYECQRGSGQVTEEKERLNLPGVIPPAFYKESVMRMTRVRGNAKCNEKVEMARSNWVEARCLTDAVDDRDRSDLQQN
ncbi:hypothetical protein HYALB_00002294 [Hymenoscyphus albidus]|uniref:Uncharacterized protein n=1 Tax=Hymenoscyphus albidus TaxID=595503 RepID=A0A9N9QBW4_9HELO|nr:hypothetical protein HYALB_00002294 [Hymenoscyphus albidus]